MTVRKALIAAAAVSWTFAVGGAALAAETKSDQPVADTVITTKVKADLAKDKGTKATDIHVKTKDGVVWLTGTVGSVAEKEKAEEDARAVKGVLDVKNELTAASK